MLNMTTGICELAQWLRKEGLFLVEVVAVGTIACVYVLAIPLHGCDGRNCCENCDGCDGRDVHLHVHWVKGVS